MRVPLVGRRAECALLAELLAGVGERGSALIVSGTAGVGKSALLAEAAEMASTAGMTVLSATGSPTELHVPFAGLQQMLYPLRYEIGKLPRPQQSALGRAIGLDAEEGAASAPTVFLVGLGVLSLLANIASDQPVLITVDDAHWLDPSSADVLTFVARRLESEPVVLVAARRHEGRSVLDEAGLPVLALDRLTDDDAANLLNMIAPDLPSSTRSGVLRIAEGNPLALMELPVTGVSLDGAVILPLSDRLKRAFTTRTSALSKMARTVLLLAALNDGDTLTDVLIAANAEPTILAPAVEAGLVELDGNTLRFRHPLVRSAIVAAADSTQRIAAHRSLAEVLRDDPDRCLWHLGAAATEPAEDLAVSLTAAAEQARGRGGVHAAIAALERAARLSETSHQRIERLLRAGELAVDAGLRDTAMRLVQEAMRLPLIARQRAVATWLLSSFDDGVRAGAGVQPLASLARVVAADDPQLAKRIVWGVSMRCFWMEPGLEARHALLALADQLLRDRHDPSTVAIDAYLAPTERAATVLAGLRTCAGAVGNDPLSDRFLGSAALQVGAFDLAARFSTAALPGLRAEGRLGLAARALAVQAWSLARLGDLPAALVAADEAGHLAEETSQPYLSGLALAVRAEVAVLHGDYHQASALVAAAERIGFAVAARPVLATTQRVRALIALGEGRHGDALADLLRMFDPTDPTYAVALRCYVLPELADAANRSGRVDELKELVSELEDLAPQTPSPALQTGLRYLRAVLAPPEQAEKLFQAALDTDLTAWPLDRGRIQLAFGEWLRRRRRVRDARAQLRAARDVFDALGVVLWGDRVRQELRAIGEPSSQPVAPAHDKLTLHELTIAQLAAGGLTNREIGQRLFISHRTVGTHLHRIFPKLGISSRAELAAVLSRSATTERS